MHYTTALQLGLEAQECLLVLGSEDDGVRVWWEVGSETRALPTCVGALRQGYADGHVRSDDNEMI